MSQSPNDDAAKPESLLGLWLVEADQGVTKDTKIMIGRAEDLGIPTAEARLLRLCNQVLTETTLPPFVGQRCLIETVDDALRNLFTVTFTLQDEQRGRGWFEWPVTHEYLDAVTDADVVEQLQRVLAEQTQVLKESQSMKPDEYFIPYAEAAFNAYDDAVPSPSLGLSPEVDLWAVTTPAQRACWIAAVKAVFKLLDVVDADTGDDKDWPVLRCARCGENHEHVLAKRFVGEPIVDEDGTTWDRWGLCPKTGDPILFRSITDDDQPLA